MFTARSLSLLLLLCSASLTLAQDAEMNKPDDDQVCDAATVQFPPEFPGGQDSLFAYLKRELRYPEDALKEKVKGKVLISFVIDKDGSVEEATIGRGVHRSLDNGSDPRVQEDAQVDTRTYR